MSPSVFETWRRPKACAVAGRLGLEVLSTKAAPAFTPQGIPAGVAAPVAHSLDHVPRGFVRATIS